MKQPKTPKPVRSSELVLRRRCETLINNLRARKAELDGADAVIRSLKAKPLCPDCDSRMVRMQWQCEDGGWVAGWLCECECNKYGRRLKPQNGEVSHSRAENQKP